MKRYRDFGNTKNPCMIRCICPYGKYVTERDGTCDYYEMYSPQNVNAKLAEL